jgi:hypothetical protein
MAYIINETQVAKKRKTILVFEITIFFGNYRPYTKFDPTQQDFLENLMLYIVKGYCFSIIH